MKVMSIRFNASAINASAFKANASNANAIDTEGKLESAYGELMGDLGDQIKAKAKQDQASAKNAIKDLKEDVVVVKIKLNHAADQVADYLS
jgi:uncharacterized protein YjbJ (UPF0337 family)